MELVEVELNPTNMHWLEKGDPHDDCCVHGGIYLRLGDRILSDGQSEWTISTAAFRLLGTVTREHNENIDDALIPCCGFNMWTIESAPNGLLIPNCSNGIDWVIHHPSANVVAHVFPDGQTILTNLHVWAEAVCGFADRVRDFYETAWPKNVYDEESRKGFELFLDLWKKRRDVAGRLNASRE